MSDADSPGPTDHPAPSSDALAPGVRYRVPDAPRPAPLTPEAQARVTERVAAARAAAQREIAASAESPSFAQQHRRLILGGLGVVSAAVACFGVAVLWTGGFRWAVLGPTLLFAAEALDCAQALWSGRDKWPLGLAWLA